MKFLRFVARKSLLLLLYPCLWFAILFGVATDSLCMMVEDLED